MPRLSSSVLDIFFMLLFLFLVAVLLRVDWIYYLIYVLGGIWLVSHWWIRRALDQLTVQRRMPTKAFSGETVTVELWIRNRSRLPIPWLLIRETVPMELQSGEPYRQVISLGSHAQARHHYRLHCRRRGYYPVGPVLFNSGDLFGFVDSAWQELAPQHITVYPKVLPLPDLGLPSRLPFGGVATRQRIFEDPARMAGVRPYTYGDSLRHIHWRASAHEDALLVKKYQPAIALNTAIILDLDRRAFPGRTLYGDSEWAIVVAASLAAYLSEQRQPVGLVTNGLDPLSGAEAITIPPRPGRGQLMSILEMLARVQVREAELPLDQWLVQRVARLEWGTSLLVVTPKLTGAGLRVLHGVYRRGLNVTALVCAQQADFRSVQKEGEALGIPVHRTLWEVDLASLAPADDVRRWSG